MTDRLMVLNKITKTKQQFNISFITNVQSAQKKIIYFMLLIKY